MYSFEPLDLSAAGLAASSSLLRAVFPSALQLTPSFLHWLYCENPAGAARGYQALCEGRIVAHYATVPFAARCLGEERRAHLVLNLATDAAHRGRRLAAELGRATLERASEWDIDLFFAVVNDQSTHLFAHTLGFERLGRLEARVGFGPPPEARPAEVEFERLWDDESLSWRLANPSVQYRLVSRARRVQVRAHTGRLGIQAILTDLDARSVPMPPDGPAGRGPTLWLGVDPALRWSRSLYWDLPLRLRPSPLNLVYRDVAGCGLPRSERIRFHGIDFDAY